MKFSFKKRFLVITGVITCLVMISSVCFCHTLYMNVVDNEDGSVTVEGMFSTGATAAGLTLFLADEKEKIIKKIKMDEFGEATFKIPEAPYTIFLDGGPGHTVRKQGPFHK